MAYAYLNAGATSFAAANWSDATGFADNAQLVVKLTGQTVSTAIDQSALSTGINRLIVPDGSTGQIGTDVAGPLKVDIDDSTGEWSTANATRSYAAVFATSGSFYFQAGGGSAVWSNTIIDTGATVYLVGGTFTTLRHSRGTLAVNSSTTLGTIHIWGPATAIISLKTSSLTTLNQYGASNVVCERAGTTLNIYGGTHRYNCTSGTTTTVNLYGGEFIHQAGDITTLNAFAGSYRAQLARAATITTANRESACAFNGNDPLLTITTPVGFSPKIDL